MAVVQQRDARFPLTMQLNTTQAYGEVDAQWNRAVNEVALDNRQETPRATSGKMCATQLRQGNSERPKTSGTTRTTRPSAATALSTTNSRPRTARAPTTGSFVSSSSSPNPSRSASPSHNPSLNPTPLSFDHLSLTGDSHPTTGTIPPPSHQIYQHNEALTSLIDSLTSINNAQRGRSPDFDTRPKSAGNPTTRGTDGGVDSFEFSPELQRAYHSLSPSSYP